MKNFILLFPLIFLLSFLLATEQVTAASSPRANVPLYPVNAGDAQLDANNWTSIWAGKVSSGDTYFDMRLVGYNAGVIVRLQFFDRYPETADTFMLNMKGITKKAIFGQTSDFATAVRGVPGGYRGWSGDLTLPWSTFGGMPIAGTQWPLSATFQDIDGGTVQWVGTLSWSLPNYTGGTTTGATLITRPLTGDATLGGNTDCGNADYPDYFPTWGNRNYGTSPYAISQNQWDVADWPCYAKQVMSWQTPTIPPNNAVVKATLGLWHFGENGYASCYEPNASGDTVYELFEIIDPVNETGVTWDNLPVPRENLSRTLVPPARAECNNGIQPPFERIFDVTELVKRAVAENRTVVSTVMYTSAGQYHSGKQFYSREGAAPPVVKIWYAPTTTTVTPTPTTFPPTITITPSPTVTSQPGDVNGDRIVNLVDLSTLLSNFGKPGIRTQGDLDGNGSVNLSDLTQLLANFGKSF